MTDGNSPKRQWLLRLQSAFVLPLARGIYLLVALASLLAVITGILYVIYLQASAAVEPDLQPLPAPYRGGDTSVTIPSRSADIALVEKRLQAPTSVRFVVTSGTIQAPLTENSVLGHFQASTLNGLARFPDGVSILGGPDAELFERVPGTGRVVGLAPRAALLSQMSEMLDGITEPQTRTFQIRVIARDEYGVASAPADVSFELRFAPAAPSQPSSVAQRAPDVEEATELQKIAGDIARHLEPTVNPTHFAVYRTALETPERCGARDDDADFLTNYRRAFEDIKPRLTATNIGAFYRGLCEAWEAVLDNERAALRQAEQQEQAARRSAEEARARVDANNDRLLAEHEVKVLTAKAQTVLTLSVVGGALAVFLLVALVLAFLALEGHSRAMRAAAEVLVRLEERRGSQATVAGEGNA